MTLRPLRTLMTTLWLGLLTAGVCAGQEAFFDEGNQRYQNGDFDGAVASYARILEAGLESGDLYYNLGNTYFKRGEIGPAILYYERARRLMPADEDLLANLALARQLTADEITPLPQFWLFRAVRWWVDLVPRSALAWLVGLAYLVVAGGGIVWILRPGTPMAAWARRGGRGRGRGGASVRHQPGGQGTGHRRTAESGGHGHRGRCAERALRRQRAPDFCRPRGCHRAYGPSV